VRLIRTMRFTVAALLTGITGLAAFPVPASAAPAARHAAASQAPAAAGVTGAAPLTLSNGTRVVVNAPWAAPAGDINMTGRARRFTAAVSQLVSAFTPRPKAV
jgi:hypothetical protein